MSLRALAEQDLGRSLSGPDWGLPVALTGPDGIRRTVDTTGAPLRGQVLYDMVRINPETGGRVVVGNPIVTLRRSVLHRVPAPGENWLVEIPVSPVDPAMVQMVLSPVRPPEGGGSIGFIRLYLQRVEQSE